MNIEQLRNLQYQHDCCQYIPEQPFFQYAKIPQTQLQFIPPNKKLAAQMKNQHVLERRAINAQHDDVNHNIYRYVSSKPTEDIVNTVDRFQFKDSYDLNNYQNTRYFDYSCILQKNPQTFSFPQPDSTWQFNQITKFK